MTVNMFRNSRATPTGAADAGGVYALFPGGGRGPAWCGTAHSVSRGCVGDGA